MRQVKLVEKDDDLFAVGPCGTERVNIEDHPNPGESQQDYQRRVATETRRAFRMVTDPSFKASASAFADIDEKFGLSSKAERPMFSFSGNRMYLHPFTGRGTHNA